MLIEDSSPPAVPFPFCRRSTGTQASCGRSCSFTCSASCLLLPRSCVLLLKLPAAADALLLSAASPLGDRAESELRRPCIDDVPGREGVLQETYFVYEQDGGSICMPDRGASMVWAHMSPR